MIDWEKVSLRSISEFIKTGKTPPSQHKEYFEGDIFWYTPGDLDNGKQLGKSQRTLTIKAIEDKKTVTFPKGTLLVACIGDIGKLGITVFNSSSSNQQITGIKPNTSVDVNYLFYWFKANKELLQHHSNSAVVPIINNKTLEKIKIPLPPIEEQKKIAAILDAADALRQKDKALIAKYEELTQSFFMGMFGDLSTNERGWDLKKLKSFIAKGSKINYGVVQPGEFFPNGVPIIRVGDFEGITINHTKLKRIDPVIDQKHKNSKLVGDELLIACVGATIGKVVLVDKRCKGFNIVRATAKVRCSDELNNVFLLSVLRNGFYQNQFKGLSRTVAQPTLNIKQIEELDIPVPPKILQNQFAQRVQQIEKQKQLAQQSLQKSEELFNSLLQRAFKGEELEYLTLLSA